MKRPKLSPKGWPAVVLDQVGMQRRRLSPTTWVAVLLAMIAGLAIVIGAATAEFDNWAPNIATEALSIAVTIAVVERIVRRESERRVRPRVDRALRVLTGAYLWFSRMVALDYASTHLTSDLTEVPDDRLQCSTSGEKGSAPKTFRDPLRERDCRSFSSRGSSFCGKRSWWPTLSANYCTLTSL